MRVANPYVSHRDGPFAGNQHFVMPPLHHMDTRFNMQGPDLYMREEIPFERWIYDFHLSEIHSIDNRAGNLISRAYAIAALGESLFKVGVEYTAYLISMVVERVLNLNLDSQHHLVVGKVQLKSVEYCAKAISSPEDAITKAQMNTDRPVFGVFDNEHDWGTPYFGRRSNPYAFDCCDFPKHSTAFTEIDPPFVFEA